MIKNVTVTSIEILADNFFQLKKVKYDVENKEGNTEHLTREVYFSANGVTVLLFNKEKGNVILTRQFRLPTFLNNHRTGMMIEACAGIVEENEDPKEGIIREIQEETGFKIDKVEKILEAYSTPGSVAEMLHYYVAEYTDKQKTSEGGGLEEESEDIEVIELAFDEAYSKIETGEIKDAKTIILLQYAKINLFEEEEEEKVFDVL